MTYTVTEIAELIRHHLVFAADTDEHADAALAALDGHIRQMRTNPLWREAEWVFCDRCGCSVDTDLIHEDGPGYLPNGDFLCSSCRWHEDD